LVPTRKLGETMTDKKQLARTIAFRVSADEYTVLEKIRADRKHKNVSALLREIVANAVLEHQLGLGKQK
jgi:hypothetical protein